jgi:hypothetical protein
LGSGLYLCHTAVGFRQGPSSLYTFPAMSDACTSLKARAGRSSSRLSSVLQPPRRAAGSPTLTPFTPGVSAFRVLNFAQVPCVYRFRHPGTGALEHNSTENLRPDAGCRQFYAWR